MLAAILGIVALLAAIAGIVALAHDPSLTGLDILVALIATPFIVWHLWLGARARQGLAALWAVEADRRFDAWRRHNIDECERARARDAELLRRITIEHEETIR